MANERIWIERTKTITSNYTINKNDNTLYIDSDAWVFNLTFPPASEWTYKITIKYITTWNQVTLVPNWNDLIEGINPENFSSFEFQSDGVNKRYVVASHRDWLALTYSLNFDWLNDFVTNDVTTLYAEPTRTQAFTFYANVDLRSLFNVQNTLYTTRVASGSLSQASIFTNANNQKLDLVLANSWTNLLRVQSVDPVPFGKNTYQITYDWSSSASGVTMYINWSQIASNIVSNTLNASIVNSGGSVTIWEYPWVVTNPLDWKVRWISLVDYVKSPAEIFFDAWAWYQSKWSGSYLFANDFNRNSWLEFLSTDSNNMIMEIQGQPWPDGEWILF